MMRPRHSGFTMIELVVVLMIVGILAVVALPRFGDKRTFETRGFYDQTLSMMRYAQKTAIAMRRNVCVTTTATTIALTYDTVLPDDGHAPSCTANVQSPTGGNFSRTAPVASAVTLSVTSFAFTSAGSPNPNASVAITISAPGEVTRTISIDRETGYVH